MTKELLYHFCNNEETGALIFTLFLVAIPYSILFSSIYAIRRPENGRKYVYIFCILTLVTTSPYAFVTYREAQKKLFFQSVDHLVGAQILKFQNSSIVGSYSMRKFGDFDSSNFRSICIYCRLSDNQNIEPNEKLLSEMEIIANTVHCAFGGRSNVYVEISSNRNNQLPFNKKLRDLTIEKKATNPNQIDYSELFLYFHKMQAISKELEYSSLRPTNR